MMPEFFNYYVRILIAGGISEELTKDRIVGIEIRFSLTCFFQYILEISRMLQACKFSLDRIINNLHQLNRLIKVKGNQIQQILPRLLIQFF